MLSFPSFRLAFSISVLLAASSVTQASAQELVTASPDITIAVDSGAIVADEEAAVDNQLGITLAESFGALPAATDVIALSRDLNGDTLLAFDTTVALAGGTVAAPGDVMRFDGSTYATEFDASAEGIPVGVRTDAVSISSSGLVLSFDTTTSLPGGLIVADEDLVRWASGSFSLILDGSTAGLASNLDIDAVHDFGGGAFGVSFDTAGSVGGIAFSDEDLMRWNGVSWSLDYDGSTADSDWVAADMNAVIVPEPGLWSLLLAGSSLLVRLRNPAPQPGSRPRRAEGSHSSRSV